MLAYYSLFHFLLNSSEDRKEEHYAIFRGVRGAADPAGPRGKKPNWQMLQKSSGAATSRLSDLHRFTAESRFPSIWR
jgi:hypothetical protein